MMNSATSIYGRLLAQLLLITSAATALLTTLCLKNRPVNAVCTSLTTARCIEDALSTTMTSVEINYNLDGDSLVPLSLRKRSSILRWQMVEGRSKYNADTSDTVLDKENRSLFESLQSRRIELSEGVGKRYIVRTQRGFLNVHDTYESGPYAIDNIVGRLNEGEIVISICKIGDWIEHDAGGWSISNFGAFTWLEPIEE